MDTGGGLELRVMVVAFCTAWTPVRDSISTELRYQTLQAADTCKKKTKNMLTGVSHLANTINYDGRDGERNRLMKMFKEVKLITCTLFEQISSRVGN